LPIALPATSFAVLLASIFLISISSFLAFQEEWSGGIWKTANCTSFSPSSVTHVGFAKIIFVFGK
jgi:hypothetical protein